MFELDVAKRSGLLVKICGITNAEDARIAIDAGADALGFNLWPKSKRYVDLRQARHWIEALPQTVNKIAILVDPSLDEALAVSALPFITGLQLHGRETPRFCARLAAEGIRFGKALPATDEVACNSASSFSTATIILDSISGGNFGGTGTAFPWTIAAAFVAAHRDLRVVLAGGLTPANVVEAVRVVRPFAVDVTSGVEASPGRKDARLLRSFIDAARAS